MATLFYLWKTVWPFNLLTIYPRWDVDPPKAWQFLPWPIMIAAGWWLWTNRGTAERPISVRAYRDGRASISGQTMLRSPLL